MSLRSFFPLALLLSVSFASMPAGQGGERAAPERKPRVEREHARAHGPELRRLRGRIHARVHQRMERRHERRERLGSGDPDRRGQGQHEHLRKRIVRRFERRHPGFGEEARKELRQQLERGRELRRDGIERLREHMRKRRAV